MKSCSAPDSKAARPHRTAGAAPGVGAGSGGSAAALQRIKRLPSEGLRDLLASWLDAQARSAGAPGQPVPLQVPPPHLPPFGLSLPRRRGRWLAGWLAACFTDGENVKQWHLRATTETACPRHIAWDGRRPAALSSITVIGETALA